MIPLEAISQTDEGFDGQMTSKELVDVKIPSRPRRRVVIVAGVIAVLTVVIVAASLIGKYVPDYIRDAPSYGQSLIAYCVLFYRNSSVGVIFEAFTVRGEGGILFVPTNKSENIMLQSLTTNRLLEFSICIGFANHIEKIY